MSEFIEASAFVVLHRSVAVAAGVVVIWMGYRLFRVGVYEKAGELRASWGDRNIVLKQSAPGVFFALFGALVLGMSVWRPVSFETGKERGNDKRSAGDQITYNSIPDRVRELILRVSMRQTLSNADCDELGKWINDETVFIEAAGTPSPSER